MYIAQPARLELLAQIRRYAPQLKGRVLDAGAGKDHRYKSLCTAATQYVTLDMSQFDGVDVVGSVDALPLPEESFDGILCTQVLGDVYDVQKAFSEFYRVLRPGGAALITEAFMDPLHAEPHDYWRFTAHSFRRLAEDAGFVVEVIEPRGGYHSVMAQMRIRYWIERLGPYERWYRGAFSLFARFYGSFMMKKDRRDKSNASALFTHGYLLFVRKPA